MERPTILNLPLNRFTFGQAILLRRLNERQSDFNESLDRLYNKALKSQFPQKIVKNNISREKEWSERQCE